MNIIRMTEEKDVNIAIFYDDVQIGILTGKTVWISNYELYNKLMMSGENVISFSNVKFTMDALSYYYKNYGNSLDFNRK